MLFRRYKGVRKDLGIQPHSKNVCSRNVGQLYEYPLNLPKLENLATLDTSKCQKVIKLFGEIY